MARITAKLTLAHTQHTESLTAQTFTPQFSQQLCFTEEEIHTV